MLLISLFYKLLEALCNRSQPKQSKNDVTVIAINIVIKP